MSSGGVDRRGPLGCLIPDHVQHSSMPANAEVRILELLADGAEHASIAIDIDVTPRQVNHLIGLARRRYGARNRAHLVALAIRAGVIA